MKITNISKGPKLIWSEAAKAMVFVNAGETVDAEISEAERDAANPEWFSFELDPLDHDGDGRKGGAVASEGDDIPADDTAEPAPRPRGRPRKDA